MHSGSQPAGASFQVVPAVSKPPVGNQDIGIIETPDYVLAVRAIAAFPANLAHHGRAAPADHLPRLQPDQQPASDGGPHEVLSTRIRMTPERDQWAHGPPTLPLAAH